MPRVKAKQKIFWPCGDNTGLGCGKECWKIGVPHLVRVKQSGHRVRNVVFCSSCAKKIRANDTANVGS